MYLHGARCAFNGLQHSHATAFAFMLQCACTSSSATLKGGGVCVLNFAANSFVMRIAMPVDMPHQWGCLLSCNDTHVCTYDVLVTLQVAQHAA